MTSLTVVSVVVRDMAAAIAFYTQLGLQLMSGSVDDDHADFAGDGVRLMLDTEELITRLNPTWTRPTGGHAIALAFECSSPSEVDNTHAALVASGATSKQEPWDAFWGQRYATVLDPDGNHIDLFCAL
ncbi:MAG: VOC family protein [Propionibacteriaceae bacterium]|nr:VOC family protein [Propionibacteriaceae bacterium]